MDSTTRAMLAVLETNDSEHQKNVELARLAGEPPDRAWLVVYGLKHAGLIARRDGAYRVTEEARLKGW